MPIMDGRGHVLCGGGGLQGSLDGTPLPFATYGGGCWADDDGTALEQLREGATDPVSGKPVPRLAVWNEGATPSALSRAANDFAGGGGAFIAWLAGYGVYGSLEDRLSGTPEEVRATLGKAGTAGPRSVAPDGTIGYIPDRQNGYGLALVDRAGRVVYVPGIPPVDVQVLGAGVAIWRGGAVGRPATRPTLADAQGVQLQTFEGRDWLFYWSEARGCVLQPDGGDSHGCIVDPRPLEFNPHMRVVGDELWICWSTTQGEGPNDLVICAMRADGTIHYVRTASGVAPMAPLWCDLSQPVTPPVQPPIEPPVQPPIEPPIEPPPVKPPVKPPIPPSPYRTHRKANAMEIDGKTVTLRGPKGMLQRPNGPGTGIWGQNADPKGTWRGSVFDLSDSNDVRGHYAAKKLPNGRYTFTSVQENCLAGEDAGWYTPDVVQQFYHKPTGNTDAGDLEQWRVYDGNENGALEAQCEQVTDDQHPSGAGKKFFAYPLAVEVVS
jgi:hypothetical protein